VSRLPRRPVGGEADTRTVVSNPIGHWPDKRAVTAHRIHSYLVYLPCAERRLPHVRLGTGRGTIRIAEDDINEYVKNSRIDAHSLTKGLKHIRAK
jgi:hypothetical protein